MSAGDVLNAKRVRTQSNERLDTVDADALSREPREHLDAFSRAIEAAPRNVGASTPTGLIFQGFGLTLNPTGPTDGKVRVQSPLGVAYDSDGRLLIKENGVQSDLVVPSGNSQVYAYFFESASDTTVRRFIPVTSPFTPEGSNTIPTKLTGGVAYYVRTGDQTSIVASDVVNGATTALCFLGVANNVAGAVTMTGYNSTTAPNGAFVTNRHVAVTVPTTLPTTNTMNGSVATMHGLTIAALYMIGQALWKGSHNTTPTAANNFLAFTPPARGLDALFDSTGESTVTPTTAWRDWAQNRRFEVDHNGYPMGQLSVIDENWARGGTQAIVVTPASAGKDGVGGAVSTVSGLRGFVFTAGVAGSASVMLPVPPNRSLQVNAAAFTWVKTTAANVVAGTLFVNGSSRSTITPPGTGTGTVTVSFPSADFPIEARTVSPFGGGLDGVTTATLSMLVSGTVATTNEELTSCSLQCVVDPEGWMWQTTNGSTSGGCTHQYRDPDTNLNHRALQMVGVGTGSQTGQMTTEAYECFMDANVAYAQEWMLRTGTITDGNNKRWFWVGVQNNSAGSMNKFVTIYNDSTLANWQLQVIGTTTVNTDTGVAIAANTVYRMRLEILGANVSTAGAGSFRIRAYINGNKVAEVVTATLPTADMIRPFILCGTTATGGPYDFSVGRLRRAWNHVVSGDNL